MRHSNSFLAAEVLCRFCNVHNEQLWFALKMRKKITIGHMENETGGERRNIWVDIIRQHAASKSISLLGSRWFVCAAILENM